MPRRILRSVMRAKKRSTWLSQDALVGVRWTCQRGLFASQLRISEAVWDSLLDLIEEFTELPRAMAAIALPNHVAGCDVEGGKQRSRTMTLVVMAAPGGLARPHRQHWLAAVQRLNLALLIDAEHDGVLGRRDIKPDNIADFDNKVRIRRKLERLDPVRLEAEGTPNALHRKRPRFRKPWPYRANSSAWHSPAYPPGSSQ